MAAVLVTGSGAVAGGDGVESLFKPAFVIEVLEELVAAVEEFARCLVGGAGDVGCGQVVLGALDGGAGALVGGVGGAEVVGPGQQVVEGGRQGVRRCALIGGGDQQEFGVGRCGVVGEPLQVVGGQVVGVVDDEQPAYWEALALSGVCAHVGHGSVGVGRGDVGVAVGVGVGVGLWCGGQGDHSAALVLGGRSDPRKCGSLVSPGVQVQ